MRPIGFSTGALARGDFRRALEMRSGLQLPAVELSALREHELEPLIAALDDLNLQEFAYVSVHAPSQLERRDEQWLVSRLAVIARRNLPLVVHPDVMRDSRRWTGFGSLLYIENMDKRKPVGRTAVELGQLFAQLPDASLCFDVGHARQVDPTMSHAVEILSAFAPRLRQLHMSEVNARSKHEALNFGTASAFRKVSHLIPENIPIILETPVGAKEMQSEIKKAQTALATASAPHGEPARSLR